MPPRRRDTEMGAFGILAFALVIVLLTVIAYYAWRWYDRQRPPEVHPGPSATGPAGSAPASAISPQAHVFGGLPRPTGGQTVRVLENKGYVSGYSEERRNPLYVGYRLFDSTMAVGPRPREFRVDVRSTSRVSNEDYAEPVYDRGHMAPNHAIARCYGQAAQEETFLLTNICPQTVNLNQKVWLALERLEADVYPKQFGDVWVLAGPIFDANPATIGPHRVQVPMAFYKILVENKTGTPRAMAVIMPQNVAAADARNLSKFLVTIRDIETQAALDFFPELPQPEQDRIETVQLKMW